MTRKRAGCLILLILLLLFLIGIVIAGIVISNRVSIKKLSPHAVQKIVARAWQEVGPEKQMEDDTCGLHTLRVIYKSYGLDPDLENLRTRLGLDVPVNPVDGSTTGILHPDMLRVLVQDGFAYEFLDLDQSNADALMMRKLSTGVMGAVLIRRRQNGRMHWVAIRRDSDDRITIIDSLVDTPYTEDAFDFVNDCVLSCIFVRPRNKAEDDRFTVDDAHFMGVHEMYRAIRQYSQRDPSKQVAE